MCCYAQKSYLSNAGHQNEVHTRSGDDTDPIIGSGAYSFVKICKSFPLDESDEVKVIAKKLENLLLKQQKKLDELEMMHEMAINNILKDLPTVRNTTSNICHNEVPGFEAHEELHLQSEAMSATADVADQLDTISNSVETLAFFAFLGRFGRIKSSQVKIMPTV